MHYFLLPMVPLTIAGAIFFKKRIPAYGFAVVLVLIKMLMTRVSPIYFFMGLGLWAIVFIARKMNQLQEISLTRTVVIATAGVLIYALSSNLGVWLVGCTGERQYAFNFAGLFACYKTSLPYAGIHFLKAVPLTIVLVQGLQWLKRRNVSVNVQRLISKI